MVLIMNLLIFFPYFDTWWQDCDSVSATSYTYASVNHANFCSIYWLLWILVGPVHSNVTTSWINLFLVSNVGEPFAFISCVLLYLASVTTLVHPDASPSYCRDRLNDDEGV